MAVLVILAVTILCSVHHLKYSDMEAIVPYHIFLYGWITAATTGLGGTSVSAS